ncbi:fimbrial protein [Lampropedia puyangensis]|uniref:Fimbrial protein n=1 Tax=Lampropedia puyangensis TaxID=1330072 RepID=A0A4S8F0B2_9BURK|nr:PilN domain-containing protein [Lampropedia puyangensis]THU00683.1 fimbrial protein [Lampropedia puyangensis]
MIRINLLPHREEAKKVKKNAFFASLGFSGLVGVLMVGLGYMYFQYLISDQENANQLIRTENARLKEKIKEVVSIEQEISALKARQKAVEDLQSERNTPVELFNQVANKIPNGSYISSLKKVGTQVSLLGVAQSNQTVSDLLKVVSDEMPWNSKPQLIETKSKSMDFGSGRFGRVYDFSMNFLLSPVAKQD